MRPKARWAGYRAPSPSLPTEGMPPTRRRNSPFHLGPRSSSFEKCPPPRIQLHPPPPLPPRKRRLYLTALWLTPMFLFSTGEGCWSICACVNRHLFVDTFPFSPLVLNNISLVEILWINIVHTDRLISRINRCVCIVLFFFLEKYFEAWNKKYIRLYIWKNNN